MTTTTVDTTPVVHYEYGGNHYYKLPFASFCNYTPRRLAHTYDLNQVTCQDCLNIVQAF